MTRPGKDAPARGMMAVQPLPDGGVSVSVRIPPPPPVPAGYVWAGWTMWTSDSGGLKPPAGDRAGMRDAVWAWLMLLNEWGPVTCLAHSTDGTRAVGTAYDLARNRWDPWREHCPPDGT